MFVMRSISNMRSSSGGALTSSRARTSRIAEGEISAEPEIDVGPVKDMSSTMIVFSVTRTEALPEFHSTGWRVTGTRLPRPKVSRALFSPESSDESMSGSTETSRSLRDGKVGVHAFIREVFFEKPGDFRGRGRDVDAARGGLLRGEGEERRAERVPREENCDSDYKSGEGRGGAEKIFFHSASPSIVSAALSSRPSRRASRRRTSAVLTVRPLLRISSASDSNSSG